MLITQADRVSSDLSDVGDPSSQDPLFIQELACMQSSTPQERLAYLELHLKYCKPSDDLPELCYLIVKEKCSLTIPSNLRAAVHALLGLPHSQTKEAYKELSDLCLENFFLCQEDGLSREEGQQLLKRIEDAEQNWKGSSPDFSLKRYLRETACLKIVVERWIECPLVFLTKRRVSLSLAELSERVNKVSIEIIITFKNSRTEAPYERTFSWIRPVSVGQELSRVYDRIVHLWKNDYSRTDFEFDVECRVNMETSSEVREKRHIFSIL